LTIFFHEIHLPFELNTVRISAFFGEFSLFSENFCIRGVSD
jgi:hypothetical protein